MDPFTIAALGSSLAGPLIGNIIAGGGAKDAAAAQAAATERAAALQERRYQETKDSMAPWLQTGQQANERLGGLVEGMQQPGWNYQQPDFQFDKFKDQDAGRIMQQAMQAMNASSLSRGGVGGGALKAMQTQAADLGNIANVSAFDRYMQTSKMNYGQEADKYTRNVGWQNNVLDRNQALSAQGVGAGQAIGGFGAGAADRAGQYIGMGGDARASGIMGNANAMAGIASGLGQGISSGLGYFAGSGGAGGGGDLSKFLGSKPAGQDWGNA